MCLCKDTISVGSTSEQKANYKIAGVKEVVCLKFCTISQADNQKKPSLTKGGTSCQQLMFDREVERKIIKKQKYTFWIQTDFLNVVLKVN